MRNILSSEGELSLYISQWLRNRKLLFLALQDTQIQLLLEPITDCIVYHQAKKTEHRNQIIRLVTLVCYAFMAINGYSDL